MIGVEIISMVKLSSVSVLTMVSIEVYERGVF